MPMTEALPSRTSFALQITASASASRLHRPRPTLITKLLPFCITLLAMAVVGTANAEQPANSVRAIEQHHVTLPGTDYNIVLGGAEMQLVDPSSQALLAAVVILLASQFHLP